jgi:histidine triad (HIT) family protein
MQDSIFTKIIKGEIPCHKIYEDDKTLALLDVHPVQPGHILVVSKLQIDKLYELDDENYQALMATVKKVSERLQEILKPKRVGLHVEGFEVSHVHIHVLPINNGFKDFTPPDPSIAPDHAALAAMAKKLAF